jgi:hypothetical protein
LTLSTRLRFTARLTALFEAAAAAKGFSSLTRHDEEAHTEEVPQASQLDETVNTQDQVTAHDVVETIQDEEQDTTQQPGEVASRSTSEQDVSGTLKRNTDTSKSLDSNEESTGQPNDPVNYSATHPEGDELLESEILHEDHGFNKLKEEDDLIDYFEDEENEAADSGRSSTVHGDTPAEGIRHQRPPYQQDFVLPNGADAVFDNDEANRDVLEFNTLQQASAAPSPKPDISLVAQSSANENSLTAQNGELGVEAPNGEGAEPSTSTKYTSSVSSHPQQQNSLDMFDEKDFNDVASAANIEALGADHMPLHDLHEEDDFNEFDGDEWYGDDPVRSTTTAGDKTLVNVNEATGGENKAEEEEYDDFDATITWDEEDGTSLPQKKSESPLGKRNFDEHAEGLSEGEFDQGMHKLLSAMMMIIPY